MRSALDDFDARRISLEQLVETLRPLYVALEEPSHEWKAAIEQEWWALEEVHAVSLDRDQDPSRGQLGLVVSGAIKRLRELLEMRPA
jgi:hypothetical protein